MLLGRVAFLKLKTIAMEMFESLRLNNLAAGRLKYPYHFVKPDQQTSSQPINVVMCVEIRVALIICSPRDYVITKAIE